MIELVRTWMLLRKLRSQVHCAPERLETLQNSLFRKSLLHAYRHVPFYRRYWVEAGFDPRQVRGTQDLAQVPIMTGPMARAAAAQDALLADNLEATPRTFLHTTGSSGRSMQITRGRGEERLWRAQGLRIWMEHGLRLHDKKAQFNHQAGTRHYSQKLGISNTQWIDPIVPVEELLDRFLEAKADWVISTPTVLRRLATAAADTAGHRRPLRGIFCQGELVDTQTKNLAYKVFGVMPVDVYTLTEVGYVAWQCERCEGLHVNADTHLVEVIHKGKPAGPGELGRLIVTDLYNRAMPFLRYDTGDFAIAARGACGCARRLPCLQSIEGRRRDAVRLKDGNIITARCVMEHISQLLSPDSYRLHQHALRRFRLEVFFTGRNSGAHQPSSLPNNDVIVDHLRALLGDVEISVQTSRTPDARAEKTYPLLVNPDIEPP
jgi:phenylacetate-CoA ligase